MSEISIIVPVYNVENYLKKCVESILSQTFTDFELLLVDDGSTDSSGEMCDELKRLDERIKVIHKENGGLSSARNAGIDVAKGKYLTFVDSDDYIDTHMLEVLYKNMVQEDADLSIVGVTSVYSGQEPEITPSEKYVVTQKEATKMILIGKQASVYAVAKLYKRNISDSESEYPEMTKRIVGFLKENQKFIYANPYFTKNRKLSLTFLRIHPMLYKVFPKMQQRYLRKVNK